MAKELPISLTAAQCKGRTFIVSGANAGIGYEVAKHLVTLGTNRVIMAVRNMESGKAAKEDIENETGRKTVLQVWHLDLAEYASVEAFAKRASSELDRVDGLVANAGIANGSWAEYEGNEANITVNLISTLLLAVLMLPKLEQTAVDDKAAAPMITFVGTVNAFQVQSSLGKIDRSKDIISDLNDREKWEMDIVNRYGLSKLLLLFAVRHLAVLRPVSQTGVTINLVHPGMCKTGLTRNMNPVVRFIAGATKMLFGRTAEAGSRAVLYGMAAGEPSHGKYLADCQIAEQNVPGWITDQDGAALQTQVWDQVASRLEGIHPGCIGRIEKA